MTKTLEEVFAGASRLPAESHGELAAVTLQELESDARFRDALSRLPH